jgi:hypothetical protein
VASNKQQPGKQEPLTLRSPSALVAIICAARKLGDEALERVARRELAGEFGIELSFRRPRKDPAKDGQRVEEAQAEAGEVPEEEIAGGGPPATPRPDGS